MDVMDIDRYLLISMKSMDIRFSSSKELGDSWTSKPSWVWWATISFARVTYQLRHSSRLLCSMRMSST